MVHGGVPSIDGVTLDDINKINRFCEPPDTGLMADLLWNDIVDEDGQHMSKRGVCFADGPDRIAKFAELNNIQFIVRSHEVKDEGFEVQKGGKVVTVFSAPNYCDHSKNKGAFIRFVSPDLKPNYVQFNAIVFMFCLNL